MPNGQDPYASLGQATGFSGLTEQEPTVRAPLIQQLVAWLRGKQAQQEPISQAALGLTGGTLLYRGEAAGVGKRLPQWILESPRFQRIKEAMGRWFTDNPEIAEWYRKEAAGSRKFAGIETPEIIPSRIVRTDIPDSIAEQYRVSNLPRGHPAVRYSRNPSREFFLPRELASQATEEMTRPWPGVKSPFSRLEKIAQPKSYVNPTEVILPESSSGLAELLRSLGGTYTGIKR